MGTPIIFNGRRAKLLTSDGLLLQSGATIDNDGQINFVKNSNGAAGTTGYIEGSYAAATRPAGTFTPSSGAGLFSISSSTVAPLSTTTTSLLLTKTAGASRQGRAIEYEFDLPVGYRAKVLQTNIQYIINSGAFVAGTGGTSPTDSSLIWYANFFNGTTWTLAEPSSFKLLSNSTTVSDVFSSTVQSPIDATKMRLIAYVAESADSAWEIKAIISVSPSVYVYGTPVTDWQSYTPTFTGFGTAANVSFFSRRVGDTLEIRGKFDAGTPTAVEARIGFPTGLVSSGSEKIGTLEHAGLMSRTVSTAVYFYNNLLRERSVGYFTVGQQSSTTNSLTKQIADAFVSTGQSMSVEASVPILGWSSSVQMSDQTDTRVVSFRATGQPTGTITGADSIAIWGSGSVVSDTHGQYNATTGRYTVTVAGYYRISGRVSISATYIAGNVAQASIYRNAVLVVSGIDKPPAITGTSQAMVTDTINCNSGDIIDVRVLSSGTAPTYSTVAAESSLSIERVSGPATIAASETIAASFQSSAGQSIVNGSNVIVDFGTKVYDTHGAVTTGAAWKFTAPISGTYSVGAYVRYANSLAWTQGGYVSALLYKNGVSYSTADTAIQTTATLAQGPSAGSYDEIKLLAGEYLDIRTAHGETTARGLVTAVTLVRVVIKLVGN